MVNIADHFLSLLEYSSYLLRVRFNYTHVTEAYV